MLPCCCSPQTAFYRIVSMLSREMALSFSQQGEDLPPWRTAQALLSRWHLGGGDAPSSTWAGKAGITTWDEAVPQGRDLFAAKRPPAYGAD